MQREEAAEGFPVPGPPGALAEDGHPPDSAAVQLQSYRRLSPSATGEVSAILLSSVVALALKVESGHL